jgi:hypothetical protein
MGVPVDVRKPKVFMSHNWGNDLQGRDNHERVKQINAGLLATGQVGTWFDEQVRGWGWWLWFVRRVVLLVQ